MKAFTKSTYGGPEILKLEEVEKPTLKTGHILVRVMANSANPADWHILRGKPFFARFSTGLLKPGNAILGADFAGIIEGIGDQVSQFEIGDRVFGQILLGGAFAEYTLAPAHACAKMPLQSSYQEMAAVPIAGVTALQALIEQGNLKSGESVLINGSSGGVGHFAVQIAKAYGARVTGVCSSRNTDFVKSLGADKVIAYDKESIHEHDVSYDLVVDTNGNLHFKDFKRMGKRGVIVGFTTLGHMISVVLAKLFSKYSLKQFTAHANTKDFEILATLIGDGKVKVHLEKIYPYTEIPAAIRHIEAMHTRGKVAMIWGETI